MQDKKPKQGTVTLPKLGAAFKQCWSQETSYNPRTWPPINHSSGGQCVVTSLVVQDFFGGRILKGYTEILEPLEVYPIPHFHCWNLLSNGREVDLTKSQFPKDAVFIKTGTENRKSLLSRKQTRMSYHLLKSRIRKFLNKN
ncbi:MAG: hypothetical protein HYT65_02810 [Candidatus Yanofskybacteria bacterium]|nr:hypothetical protein [Candidatus Yanofskybacteria bacterium]